MRDALAQETAAAGLKIQEAGDRIRRGLVQALLPKRKTREQVAAVNRRCGKTLIPDERHRLK